MIRDYFVGLASSTNSVQLCGVVSAAMAHILSFLYTASSVYVYHTIYVSADTLPQAFPNKHATKTIGIIIIFVTPDLIPRHLDMPPPLGRRGGNIHLSKFKVMGREISFPRFGGNVVVLTLQVVAFWPKH